ncbi:MAG: bifunctional adenosylcobinamide kinase/adenosylcobinamide-phosphate guanylyltransferase [Clostridiales bacterium]|nr:bifunctional adenosylcobinamide kinase/adenosylcobinamide-phosphate guanylyltransferase [Clostridiales bacterium]
MIALITGGNGCGKSFYAERLAVSLAGSPLYYIATMRACDDDARARVARHRAQRAGKGFTTIECPLTLDDIAISPGGVALLECLPTLLADEMFHGGDPARILPGLKRLAAECAHLIVVANDVFSDGLAYDEYTRDYMARLAALNAAAAEMADLVVEVVYSIPVAVKGVLPCGL